MILSPTFTDKAQSSQRLITSSIVFFYGLHKTLAFVSYEPEHTKCYHRVVPGGVLWPEFITIKPKVNKRVLEPNQFQIKQNKKKLSLSRLFKLKRLFFSRQSQTTKYLVMN